MLGKACPIVGSLPACYLAFLGYLAIVMGLALLGRTNSAPRLFYTGVATAGELAPGGEYLPTSRRRANVRRVARHEHCDWRAVSEQVDCRCFRCCSLITICS